MILFDILRQFKVQWLGFVKLDIHSGGAWRKKLRGPSIEHMTNWGGAIQLIIGLKILLV